MDIEIPQWLILPYWAIILVMIIDIFGIILNSLTVNNIISKNIKVEDIKRTNTLFILPRIYLIAIYFSFLMFDTSIDWRSFLGRWGIFGLLATDSYCHYSNYIYHYWYEIRGYIKNIKQKNLEGIGKK